MLDSPPLIQHQRTHSQIISGREKKLEEEKARVPGAAKIVSAPSRTGRENVFDRLEISVTRFDLNERQREELAEFIMITLEESRAS